MSHRAVPEGLAEKLTAAASDLALSFDEVRMEDIATASGIPRATLYYYFAGKNDVLAFLLESMLDDLRISVSTALDVAGDTQTRLQAVMRAQLGHLAANPAAAQLLLMNLGRAGRLGVIASGLETGFQEPVRGILADGVDAGELLDMDVDVTATAMYGAVTIVGLRTLVTTGGIDVDAITDHLFPVFWSGIAAQRARARRSRR